MIDVEVEVRSCIGCGNKFKVKPTSTQKYHSANCAYTNPVGRQTGGSDVEPKTEIVSVRPIDASKPSNKGAHVLARNATFLPAELRRSAAKREASMQGTQPEKTPDAMPEEQPTKQLVLSEDSRKTLLVAASDSMTLLNKSGDRLMMLIEESVSDSDLAKSKDGTQRVEPHKILQAVQAANALASTVQTQVNMVKAMTGLLQKDK